MRRARIPEPSCGHPASIGYTDTVDPRTTLTRFDAHLAEHGLELDAVVVGGAALCLMGTITRPTRDCDILHPALPAAVRAAAAAFAQRARATGYEVDDDWLNDGPASLAALLPEGWEARTTVVFRGTAIRLRGLARLDLLRSKVFALCDRGIDLGDCVALAPTAEELAEVLPWVEDQDANPEWPTHVGHVFADLGRRLGHGA